MKKLTTTFSALTVAALLATPVFADDHKYEISGAAGQYFFDNDRNVDDDLTYGAGLGYVINPTWTVEAWWMELGSEVEDTNIDVDTTQYRLDALYHFAPSNGWQPFLAFGAGEMEFDVQSLGKADETQVNFGVGVKRILNENFTLRGDLRAFHSLDEEDTDFAALLGLTYTFGGHSSAVAAAPIKTPVAGDADNDGVVDSADACPNTPEGIAVGVDGCPLDTDRDGVYDSLDKCPETAVDLKVDADGCPMELTEVVSIELKVNFDSNSAVVKNAYLPEIENVAKFAKQYLNTVIVVEGHTDDSGSDTYNKTLSERRAKAVEKVLEEQFGLAADRVSAKGYGEERPLMTNATAEGRAANRRVVAEISSTVKKMETK